MKKRSRSTWVFLAFTLIAAANARAQQVPDTNFKPPIAAPAYADGKGPVVLIDEAHDNFHTAGGRYQTFADLLRRDGYLVQPSKAKFGKETLRAAKILVIANALGPRNRNDWSPPYEPAFTDDEVAAVRAWVAAGGSLLLIVDHLPMPAAADKLAQAFGVQFHNGYALAPGGRGGAMVFKREDNSLLNHTITRGRNAAESVDAIATFTGSAFQLKQGGEPLFALGPSVESYTPAAAGQIAPDTPKTPVGGWLQGAVLRVEKGRVAVFGEAAMFSAQLAGPQQSPMGMNAPVARRNPQFLLNVVHWLSGLLQ
jgi:hypothetical protein